MPLTVLVLDPYRVKAPCGADGEQVNIASSSNVHAQVTGDLVAAAMESESPRVF